VKKKTLKLNIKINAVPASRPRISKWGTYYGKKYTAFRKEAPLAIKEAIQKEGVSLKDLPLTQTLECEFIFSIQQPKKTKLDYPRCDVDNLLKGIQDSLEGILFENDNQIVSVKGKKQWAPKHTTPSIQLKLKIVDS